MKLIKIGAMWCGACIIMDPLIKEIVAKYKLEYVEYDYDFDEFDYKAGDTLPILILEKNGSEISRLIGEKKQNDIEEWLEEVL